MRKKYDIESLNLVIALIATIMQISSCKEIYYTLDDIKSECIYLKEEMEKNE